ncbi:MAG: phosphoribosylformylglycinamidine synthase subunit PurL [Chloroherpetonaceae bacterium]|nr:phosphoribosylformylglycinamidine synthase subunit PurL [Chloroherpetonaceae bacterium]
MSKEPAVTQDLAKEHGLTADEYAKIIEYLGRTPTFTELGIYSVMWSEHCSYKNSIAELKKLPRSKEAGKENAGIVRIGDGLAVAFKIESHNHPSAVEPYQGAATGVGGIHRDIFTMGARPIAALNSLRFGNLSNERVKFLLDGVVRGIGDYGNSFGVPTVGGEVYFHECYTGNPLVNAMSVGIVEESQIARAIAPGEGNPVIIVGSSTGRDGIHGATFASEEISEASESKRPSVQVGDPFAEKLLLEATLEALATGYILGIQDMGAAGITCSSTEMSAKAIEELGSGGMELHLEKVPIREKGMSAYEIMLSESQERMLLVAQKGKENDIISIFEKWDLKAVVIGKVTADNRVKVYFNGELKADVPPVSLVLGGGAPVYIREAKEQKPAVNFPALMNDREIDFHEATLHLLSRPNISNKAWIYDQYDSMVRTNTSTLTGTSDSAIIRIKGTQKGLSMKTDCNAKYVYLNPRKGAQIAVSECARNIAASGAKPLGVTNCLNFGNPMKPEIYHQFREAVGGMGDACRKFQVPVTGGNVSFYNETQQGDSRIAVYPTPTIGMVGLLEDIENQIPSHFITEGDLIYIVGMKLGDSEIENLNGSEFIDAYYNELGTDAPVINLDVEYQLQEMMVEIAKMKLLSSAHDLSDGGFAIASIESSIMYQPTQIGARYDLQTPTRDTGIQEFLYSETQGRILVSLSSSNIDEFQKICSKFSIEYERVGIVGGNDIEFKFGGKNSINFKMKELNERYFQSIPEAMSH